MYFLCILINIFSIPKLFNEIKSFLKIERDLFKQLQFISWKYPKISYLI